MSLPAVLPPPLRLCPRKSNLRPNTAFTDDGLEPDTAYTFTVRAIVGDDKAGSPTSLAVRTLARPTTSTTSTTTTSTTTTSTTTPRRTTVGITTGEAAGSEESSGDASLLPIVAGGMGGAILLALLWALYERRRRSRGGGGQGRVALNTVQGIELGDVRHSRTSHDAALAALALAQPSFGAVTVDGIDDYLDVGAGEQSPQRSSVRGKQVNSLFDDEATVAAKLGAALGEHVAETKLDSISFAGPVQAKPGTTEVHL